jgi:hypothetical protein
MTYFQLNIALVTLVIVFLSIAFANVMHGLALIQSKIKGK